MCAIEATPQQPLVCNYDPISVSFAVNRAIAGVRSVQPSRGHARRMLKQHRRRPAGELRRVCTGEGRVS